MAKRKYCYVIVNKENGNMLVEDNKLPFYWDKEVAKRRCLDFNTHLVQKIVLEDIENLILGLA